MVAARTICIDGGLLLFVDGSCTHALLVCDPTLGLKSFPCHLLVIDLARSVKSYGATSELMRRFPDWEALKVQSTVLRGYQCNAIAEESESSLEIPNAGWCTGFEPMSWLALQRCSYFDTCSGGVTGQVLHRVTCPRFLYYIAKPMVPGCWLWREQ